MGLRERRSTNKPREAEGARGQLRRAGGRAVPEPVRSRMESALNFSFTDVRVHDDAAARHAASQVDASAFVEGEDIFMAPVSSTIDEAMTIAHELVHVAQIDRAGPTRAGPVRQLSNRADDAEREAESSALGAMLGAPATATAAPVAALSRKEEKPWWREAIDTVGFASDQIGMLGSLVQGADDIGTAIANSASLGLGGSAVSASQGAALGNITGPLGGITGGLGLVTGLATALDSGRSGGERVLGGLSATSGGIGLLGSLVPGFGAGGAAGLAAPVGTGAGAAFGAGGTLGVGAAIGSAGAVLGAGLAGIGAGTYLSENTVGGEVATDTWALGDALVGATTGNLFGFKDDRSQMLQLSEYIEDNPWYMGALAGATAAPAMLAGGIASGVTGAVSGIGDLLVPDALGVGKWLGF